MDEFVKNPLNSLSEEEKEELMRKKSTRPSARPMGEIYPKAIQRILQGESPKITVSMLDKNSTLTEEEKEKRLEEIREKEERHKIFHELRQELNPTFCPKCGRFMKDRLDNKFYKIRKMCFTCVLKQERKIRDAGLWDKYENKIITENKLSFLRDVKQEVEDFLNGGLKRKYEYVNEEGKIETWENESYDSTKKFLENTLEDIKNIHADLTEYLNELNEELKNIIYE